MRGKKNCRGREEALRREEYRYRKERSMSRRQAYPSPVQPGRQNPSANQPSDSSNDLYQGRYPGAAKDDPTGRTRVIGTRHEVDDRTRVYRSEEEQTPHVEEAWKKQVYERRRVSRAGSWQKTAPVISCLKIFPSPDYSEERKKTIRNQFKYAAGVLTPDRRPL